MADTTVVRVRVLDPGTTAERDPRFGWEGCTEPAGPGAYRVLPHAWMPAALNADGAVWICTRCRRIEQRTIEVDTAPENPSGEGR